MKQISSNVKIQKHCYSAYIKMYQFAGYESQLVWPCDKIIKLKPMNRMAHFKFN